MKRLILMLVGGAIFPGNGAAQVTGNAAKTSSPQKEERVEVPPPPFSEGIFRVPRATPG
jgi:hypothetical protein